VKRRQDYWGLSVELRNKIIGLKLKFRARNKMLFSSKHKLLKEITKSVDNKLRNHFFMNKLPIFLKEFF